MHHYINHIMTWN